MCRRDQSGTLGDGRCASLAELWDWWNIHSCCWSNVKQQTGWLHSNIFLSPWQQNVTKWLSDKMQLISALKNIPSWCKTKPVISTIIKKTVSLKKGTGSLLVFPDSYVVFEAKSAGITALQKRDSRKIAGQSDSPVWLNQTTTVVTWKAGGRCERRPKERILWLHLWATVSITLTGMMPHFPLSYNALWLRSAQLGKKNRGCVI